MSTYLSKNLISELTLSPFGSLHLNHDVTIENPTYTEYLQNLFSEDWRKAWFYLAADKKRLDDKPALYFWQMIASKYMTSLCHFNHEEEFTSIPCPGRDQLSSWVLQAPPMKGGEYLSITQLEGMWEKLNSWVASELGHYEDLKYFLRTQASSWQQVGQVCFHLAENKTSEEYPFAFLATYATGLTANGKVKYLPLKKALEQCSGENNKSILIKMLTPVQKASLECLWLRELLEKGGLYQALRWSSREAYQFLSSIPQLEASGLSIKIPNWWRKRSRPQVSVTIDNKGASVGVDAVLDFDLKVALGDVSLSQDEMRELLKLDEGLAFIKGQWVEVNGEKLQEALQHWENIEEQFVNGEVSFVEGMRLLAGAPIDLQEQGEVQKHLSWSQVIAGKSLEKTLSDLRSPTNQCLEYPLKDLQATLRPYQKLGVNWLVTLSKLGLGACLADDMGLGKTIQILSLLLISQKQPGTKNPSLLVVPASLLGNWKQESQRFTPSLNLMFVHPSELGSQRMDTLSKNSDTLLKDVDLVVTTYSMIFRQTWLLEQSWNLVILDEAQAIKNAGTKQSKAVKELRSYSRIALTGTPIENRLSDLWSLFDFLNPGLLGSTTRFKEYVKSLQLGEGQFEALRKLVSPYILRRMKTDPKIISDLPEKIETLAYCQLSKEQVKSYQTVVKDLQTGLESVDGLSRKGLVLQALMRLKQICNHPSHFYGDNDYKPSHSGKFQRLGQICDELASRQEKVLIFTQFSEVIEPLENYLRSVFHRPGLILHGKTPIKKRKLLVEEFQKAEGPPFFILSLKAGGTGLTLTEASHVIHFDRWWNPAVENQATDRAFRIGQKKNVLVHKFITQGTIEEKIDAIIASKQQLASEILDEANAIQITELGDEELLDLVSLDIDRARMQ